MKAQDEFSVIAIESRFQFVSGARSSDLRRLCTFRMERGGS